MVPGMQPMQYQQYLPGSTIIFWYSWYSELLELHVHYQMQLQRLIRLGSWISSGSVPPTAPVSTPVPGSGSNNAPYGNKVKITTKD